MNAVFADTSFYIALLDDSDSRHTEAICQSRQAVRLVLTDCILLELGNSFARSKWRSMFSQLVRELRTDALAELVPLSPELLDAGLHLYARRDDKEWSLTDCVSFVVMKERGIKEALTTDHHFQQAGFAALLS